MGLGHEADHVLRFIKDPNGYIDDVGRPDKEYGTAEAADNHGLREGFRQNQGRGRSHESFRNSGARKQPDRPRMSGLRYLLLLFWVLIVQSVNGQSQPDRELYDLIRKGFVIAECEFYYLYYLDKPVSADELMAKPRSKVCYRMATNVPRMAELLKAVEQRRKSEKPFVLAAVLLLKGAEGVLAAEVHTDSDFRFGAFNGELVEFDPALEEWVLRYLGTAIELRKPEK